VVRVKVRVSKDGNAVGLSSIVDRRKIFLVNYKKQLTPLWMFVCDVYRVKERLQCFSCLQCFDTVGWAAGRASGL